MTSLYETWKQYKELITLGVSALAPFVGRYLWKRLKAWRLRLKRLREFEQAMEPLLKMVEDHAGLQAAFREFAEQATEHRTRLGQRMDFSDAQVRLLEWMPQTGYRAGWIADLEGELISVMPGFEDLTGRSATQMTGGGWLALVMHNERAMVEEEWRAAVKHRRGFDLEFCLRQRLGGTAGLEKPVRVRAQSRLVYSADGRPTHFVGFVETREPAA